MRPSTVTIQGRDLQVEELAAVSCHGATVKLTEDPKVWKRVEASRRYIVEKAEAGEPIYGVTTGFGGMANVVIPAHDVMALQNNLLCFLKTGAGGFLPEDDVRAAMLLRANSHLKGASGVRRVLIERIEAFLNAGVTPKVRELGSIGASGDLVPLTNIAGALLGLGKHFKVDFQGEEMDALSALRRLDLQPLELQPKEGLAMVNGTSVMTGIAANNVHRGYQLLSLGMAAHALFFQGLHGTNQSFHPYIHKLKAHPGQIWSAAEMLTQLRGSQLVRDELDGSHDHQGEQPIQDRYSLRCMPQYMGPIIDGFWTIKRQVETEMNCANDNPLIDPDEQVCYHAGNFLGQYIGVAMDQFRYYIGLMAKHLDVKIALLVAPEFNNGLSPSLVGNASGKVNMGFKGLQIAGNSIMPMLTHLGNSIVDRFPTHAEQFNQNINSQGFGSARLARQSVELCQQHMAISLLFGIQAVELRTKKLFGHFDPRKYLPQQSLHLYEAIMDLTDCKPCPNRSFIWDDREQALEHYVECVANDLAAEGKCIAAVEPTLRSLYEG